MTGMEDAEQWLALQKQQLQQQQQQLLQGGVTLPDSSAAMMGTNTLGNGFNSQMSAASVLNNNNTGNVSNDNEGEEDNNVDTSTGRRSTGGNPMQPPATAVNMNWANHIAGGNGSGDLGFGSSGYGGGVMGLSSYNIGGFPGGNMQSPASATGVADHAFMSGMGGLYQGMTSTSMAGLGMSGIQQQHQEQQLQGLAGGNDGLNGVQGGLNGITGSSFNGLQGGFNGLQGGFNGLQSGFNGLQGSQTFGMGNHQGLNDAALSQLLLQQQLENFGGVSGSSLLPSTQRQLLGLQQQAENNSNSDSLLFGQQLGGGGMFSQEPNMLGFGQVSSFGTTNQQDALLANALNNVGSSGLNHSLATALNGSDLAFASQQQQQQDLRNVLQQENDGASQDLDGLQGMQVHAKGKQGRKGKLVPVKRMKRKKDENRPKRPLSAYNLFFRDAHKKLHGDKSSVNGEEGAEDAVDEEEKKKLTGYAHLAKIISMKWKSIDKETMDQYRDLAAKEKERYMKEMEVYQKRFADKEGDKPNEITIAEGSSVAELDDVGDK